MTFAQLVYVGFGLGFGLTLFAMFVLGVWVAWVALYRLVAFVARRVVASRGKR